MNLANLVKKPANILSAYVYNSTGQLLELYQLKGKKFGSYFWVKKGEGKGGAGLITKSATNITPFSLLLISYLLKCFDCLVWVNLSYKRESSLVCLMFKQIFFFFHPHF